MENIPGNENPVPPVEQRKKKGKGGIWLALTLILVGIILLMKNLDITNFTFHWWALFIFIPVFNSLSSAWTRWQNTGHFDSPVRGSLGSAVLVGTVAVMLLFGMDWNRWWPLPVIALGGTMLINGLGVFDRKATSSLSIWMGLSGWIGLAVILVGLGFLAGTAPIAELQAIISRYPRWWAMPILAVGIGAFISVLIMFFRNNRQMVWEAWSLLLISVFTIAAGLFAFYDMNLEMLLPIVLVSCGLVILIGLIRRK